MQIVLAGIADVDVDLADFGFRLFPVLAELHFPRQAALIAFQPLLMFFEAIRSKFLSVYCKGCEWVSFSQSVSGWAFHSVKMAG